ncbi:MAG: hypothetical protein U0271_19270 [Polyangiaceae bacterium]
MKSFAVGAVTCIGLLGCSSERGSHADAEVAVSQPSSSSSETAEALPRHSQADDFKLPAVMGVALGQPCDATTDWKCGKNNFASIEESPNHYVGEPLKPPCEFVPVESKNNGYAASACVADDHLLIALDCLYCRMPSNSILHARISMLTAEQQKRLFDSLQLTGSPPTNAAEWRSAIARNRAQSH